jgi:hypothetical protein
MRTAAICPTCATYENAVCVIYDGETLSNIGVPPLTDLQTALGSIDASLGSAIALINSVAANPIFLTTTGTSGPATLSGNVLNIPNYQPYKVFIGYIDAVGSTLTITTIENTIGTISFSSYGVGPYYFYLTSSGLFTSGKTVVIHGESSLDGPDKLVRVYYGNSNVIKVYGYNAGVIDESVITGVPIEIRVYP